MATERLNSQTYRSVLAGGLKRLEEKCDQINKLNVFPVPDGDTGDNMFMTLQSGLAETAPDGDLERLCEALSKGMLYGARGNSGVILSRFFYGMDNCFASCGGAVTTDAFTAGLERGVSEAYAAVSNPREGTILTVMRETANAVRENAPADYEALFRTATAAAASALKRTPEQLEVLKNAGVVDSGGAGFLCILEGMMNALERGETYTVHAAGTAVKELSGSEEMLGYCTEFILQLMGKEPFSLDAFKAFLNSVGNSVVAFENGAIVKVHVHTFRPEDVLRAAHRYGEFLTLKIENMSVMHSESVIENSFEIPGPKNPYGLVAVACGDGVRQMLSDSGCTVVDGGRSMNPSAQDIADGIRKAAADTVFVFPNHRNVLLAANQAKEMCGFCQVVIIPTEDIGQCYQAISFFDREKTADELAERFDSARDLGMTVQVAQAIRSCVDHGVTVREGDWLCFDRDRILVADRDRDEAVVTLFGQLPDPPDVVILLYGEGLTEAEASALTDRLTDLCPDTEWITINGGQPIYPYTILIR